MAFFDMPLDQLRTRRTTAVAPDDLEEFWDRTFADARAAARPTRVEPVPTPLRLLEVSDVRFTGFGGDEIRAWLQRPTDGPVRSIVVEYIGYGGGRGEPHEVSAYAVAGHARLLVDTRGQGWGLVRGGDTPDPQALGVSGLNPLTRGIEDPETYYYRRAYTDAARAVEVARELVPGVLVVAAGGSQGGALAIAAAALGAREGQPGVDLALVDVPFLQDLPRAVGLVDAEPYAEISPGTWPRTVRPRRRCAARCRSSTAPCWRRGPPARCFTRWR
ncbi:acetylxylan esterase [Brachybacterium sillae]|uniref:acetylxylan esterase n=1 Tax=Brachybacterium sillae TaxID=2810536 RepID=UPI0032E8023C